MDDKKLRKIGKYISFLLRHSPEKESLEMDKQGYVKTSDLLSALQIDQNQIDWIVENNNKKRFEYKDNKELIRATQGHSFEIDLGIEESEPPSDFLYHGTSDEYLESILKEGLLKMNRNHVHLSTNLDTARQVGDRHSRKNNRKTYICTILAKKMLEDGYKFYVTSNGVWLTDHVPAKYISRNES